MKTLKITLVIRNVPDDIPLVDQIKNDTQEIVDQFNECIDMKNVKMDVPTVEIVPA